MTMRSFDDAYSRHLCPADELAATVVYRRIRRDGQKLSAALVRDTVLDLGGAADADRVRSQVIRWLAQIASTGRRAVRRPNTRPPGRYSLHEAVRP